MRLADALAGLSRLADVGFGLPMGAALRSCVLATRLARSLDLPAADVQTAFYTALLHHVGCVGYAPETARLFGDELVTNAAAGRTDSASARDVVATFLPTLTHGQPPLRRARLAFTALTMGGRWGDQFTISAIVEGLGGLLALLRDADRATGVEIYARVGLRMTYRPGTETIMAELVSTDLDGALRPGNFLGARGRGCRSR
jgi:hypothetical protein